jgi:hypothetical protein
VVLDDGTWWSGFRPDMLSLIGDTAAMSARRDTALV